MELYEREEEDNIKVDEIVGIVKVLKRTEEEDRKA